MLVGSLLGYRLFKVVLQKTFVEIREVIKKSSRLPQKVFGFRRGSPQVLTITWKRGFLIQDIVAV